MTGEEDSVLPIKEEVKNEDYNVSPKTKSISTPYIFFFNVKAFQFFVIFTVVSTNDFGVPWFDNFKDFETEPLSHIFAGGLPCILLTIIILAIVSGKLELNSGLVFCLTFFTSILLSVCLVYLRFLLKADDVYYWIIFLGTMVLCLLISLLLCVVKNHPLLVINLTLALGMIGFNVFFILMFADRLNNSLVFVNCIIVFVIYFYYMCICLCLNSEYEKIDEENAMILACKSYHWFLIPFMIIGIMIGVAICILCILFYCLMGICKVCCESDEDRIIRKVTERLNNR